MSTQDTIAAIATPPGVGGIGIIRLSGTNSLQIAETLTTKRLSAGQIIFCHFYDDQNQQIDFGICLFFQNPHSFTSEDVVEIQGHGGPILLDMLLSRVCQLGARLARAGEFSERAFLNGKIDLTQAEAIADLIESRSQAAAKAAMRSLQGKFSDEINLLEQKIIQLRAFTEAALDFSEEEVDFLADADIEQQLDNCQTNLSQVLLQAEKGRVLQEGLNIVIAGLPNAGKSSLLNTLAGYDAAIVTPIPGTTRDLVKEEISLKGIPVHITDTAGLRESDDKIELEGINRAWKEIQKADMVLLLVDAVKGIQTEDKVIIKQLKSITYSIIYSKCDLISEHEINASKYLHISTLNEEGIEQCINLITGKISDYNQDNQQILARRRHVEALHKAQHCLSDAKNIFVQMNSPELMAEDLRQVQRYLNEITGDFTTEDLLGKIFSSFCIGK